jgi:hypothetical protein
VKPARRRNPTLRARRQFAGDGFKADLCASLFADLRPATMPPPSANAEQWIDSSETHPYKGKTSAESTRSRAKYNFFKKEI